LLRATNRSSGFQKELKFALDRRPPNPLNPLPIAGPLPTQSQTKEKLMLKIKLKDLFWTAAALFCATQFCSAQSSDNLPSVQAPPSRPGVAVPNSESDLTMAGESKSTKEVVEQEKPVCLNVYFEGGYTSEYMFRGTNLMPDSDGGGFLQAQLSKWGFTIGAWGINQFGTASAPGWAMGESGGGGGSTNRQGFLFQDLRPETVQSQFNEVDLILEYHREFGWFDVSVGNIAFFIDRNAKTSLDADIPLPFGLPPLTFKGQPVGRNTLHDETFDRIYVSLSTSKIPYVTPKITYYQTVYSDGSEPVTKEYLDPDFFQRNFGFPGGLILFDKVHQRNDALGGYLEGRLNGHFHVSDRIDVNPYWLISYSFHDRTEPIDNPQTLRDEIRGRSLVGFNHTEVGIDVPILLLHWTGVSKTACAPPDGRLRLVPFGRYAYHIANPNPGTDRNEWWGGVKLTLSF
jgi:hypothetical protein